jgi:hypothetical protein
MPYFLPGRGGAICSRKITAGVRPALSVGDLVSEKLTSKKMLEAAIIVKDT